MKEFRFPLTYYTSPRVVSEAIIRELKDNNLYDQNLLFACCFPNERKTEFYAGDEKELDNIVMKSMKDGKVIHIYNRDSLESSGNMYSEKEKPLATAYLIFDTSYPFRDIEFMIFFE